MCIAYGSEAQYASLRKVSCLSVKSLMRYRDYWIFQNGGRSPSWICYVRVSLVTTSIWWYLTLCDGIDTVVSIICKC